MTTEVPSTTEVVFKYVLAFILCLTVLAVFIPLNPAMPMHGLDKSWMFAMNQAVAQDMVFGRDMVFTFGPYASIYTEMYHPATDRLMVWGSLFLGINYFLLLLLLGTGKKFYGLLLYAIFLAGFLYSRDALLFSCPLITALVVYRVTLPDDHAMKLHLSTRLEYGVAFLFASLGLLPLIKGSLLPVCAATAALCAAVFLQRGRKTLALLAAIVPSVSCALFWRISGQPTLSLPGFFWSMRPIITGYTEAMAFTGDPWEYVLYALGAGLILMAIAWTATSPKISRVFLGVTYAFFLFTAFKAGFIRHDPWHNVTAGTAIFIAALLLVFVLGEKRTLLPLAMAVLVWTYIGHNPEQTAADNTSVNLLNTYEQALKGLLVRWGNSSDLQKSYDEHLATIRKRFPVPQLPGTTDIYSFNQSWVLASHNTWASRPVPQSYSVYTPDLAQMNLRHLESTNAPDNILFRVEPIDGRLPSLEDGLSWPALINNYSLHTYDGQSVFLRKRAPEKSSDPSARSDLYNSKHNFGEEVAIPDASDPLFARVEIAPTLLGKLASALFKPTPLYISLRLRDGSTIKYRTFSNMMQSYFLVTPLVKNTEDFTLLKAGGSKYLIGNQVKSVTLSAENHGNLFWNSTYTLHLRKSPLALNTDTENSVLFDKIEDAVPERHAAPTTLACEGAIEAVNGTPPRSGIAPVGNAVSVRGWMAVSGANGIVPDSIFVTLTNESGKTIYVKARSRPHEDIKFHFKQPGMPDPGYAAMIDVSGLTSGNYTLGLARTYQGNLNVCEQYKLPFLIAR